MEKNILFELKEAAAKRIPFDLLIKNVKLVDVFTLEIVETAIGIKHGRIVSFDEHTAHQVIDGEGSYVAPLLMDAHMHLESTLVEPYLLSDILLSRGIGTVIADPHEIVNACGKAGIDYILAATDHIKLDVYVNVPSCVPSTPFETAYKTFDADEIRPYYQHPRVLGLAEVMSYANVLDDENMLDKLFDAIDHDKHIDGHGSVLDATGLDVYTTMKIRNDHECTSIEAMQERMRRGMQVFIREGSVAQNLEALIPGINERNYQNACFCSDDRHADDLIRIGSIDHALRLAITKGCDPLIAIAMATINVARAYQLKNVGAIAPGYEANLFFFSSLEHIEAKCVIHQGEIVAKEGEMLVCETNPLPHVNPSVLASFHVAPYTKEALAIPVPSRQAEILVITPGSIVSERCVEEVNIDEQGNVLLEGDLAKMVVVERHHETGNIGACLVKNFGLKDGAIATSVAHDSHNIIGIGQNDDDLYLALKAVEQMHGGYVVVRDGEVVASLPLPIAGLMSLDSKEEILRDLDALHAQANTLLTHLDFHPFMMLSFMALPVIPTLKLTDFGLFDVLAQKIINVDHLRN